MALPKEAKVRQLKTKAKSKVRQGLDPSCFDRHWFGPNTRCPRSFVALLLGGVAAGLGGGIRAQANDEALTLSDRPDVSLQNLLAQAESDEGVPPPPPPPPEEPQEPATFEEPPQPIDTGSPGIAPPPPPQAPQPPSGGAGVGSGRMRTPPGPGAPGTTGSDLGSIPVNPGEVPAKKIPPGEELVTIDFPEPVPIKDIIKAVAAWTGKNFILGQGVASSARVSIISPQQVTKEEAYQAFLSALNVAGFTTVDTGRMVKIIPTRSATSSNIKTFYGASWAPMTDEIITQIIPLTYIDAQTVATQLKSILRNSNAVPFPTTNSLIVSDTGHKIRRLLEIILLLDVKGNQPQVAIVPISFMDAADVAKKIQEIFGRAGSRSGGSLYLQKVIVDERSNSTILIGPPRGLDDVVRLIKRLDRQLEDQAQQAQIHVRPLEYADATKLATTLQALAQGTSDNRAALLRNRLRTGGATGAGGQPGQGGPEPVSVADLGNVKITADAATNSLIIQGSSAAFKEVDNIIRMLDQRKSQVYVEADIIDVSIGKGLSIGGSSFAGFNRDDFVYPFGWRPATIGGFSALSSGTNVGSTQAASLLQSLPNNAVVGVLSKKTIEVAGLKLTPGAFIFALKQDSNSNVLQTPSLLVADNEEAEFVAADSRTVYSAVTSPQGGSLGEKGEKDDAELSLKIKPQISKSDVVNMDLGLKADEFGALDARSRPLQKTKRSFNTKLSVQDGQTIVISGLQRDAEKEAEDKVPLLGDIPIIGWLFRDTKTERNKTNLMIFLTPYVVRNSEDLSRIYDKKLRDQKEFLEKFYGDDYREKDVFARLPNEADGRVPPPKPPRDDAQPQQTPAPGQPGGAALQPEGKIQLPSEDPDPIVVPAGEGGGGGNFSGGDSGGAPPPPPPPPPPPGDGGDGGDLGGGE